MVKIEEFLRKMLRINEGVTPLDLRVCLKYMIYTKKSDFSQYLQQTLAHHTEAATLSARRRTRGPKFDLSLSH